MNNTTREITLVRQQENGETWWLIKEVGPTSSRLIKTFAEHDEDQARNFFENYENAPRRDQVVASKVVTITSEPLRNLGNVVLNYRGITVTDRPHGETPFTLIQDGQVIQHHDDRTLSDIINTIDVLLDGVEDAEDWPDWRENQDRLERLDRERERYAKEHPHPAKANYDSEEEFSQALEAHKATFMAGWPTTPKLIGRI